MDLEDKVALVTGAAKRLGRATAMAFAQAGADVAVHYSRSGTEARETAERIRASGRRAEMFQADLSDPKQIEQMFVAVEKAFGHLDILVNNAGIHRRTSIEDLTAEHWDAVLAVNARAPALCIRHAVALMPDGGAIVNITDIAAEKARAGYPAYCASKGAVLALTKSAAKALAPRNIRVNAVAPGAVLWQAGTSEQQKKDVLAQVPMKRTGSPEDVAAAVVFLAGHDYITAQTLRVDGGWHMA